MKTLIFVLVLVLGGVGNAADVVVGTTAYYDISAENGTDRVAGYMKLAVVAEDEKAQTVTLQSTVEVEGEINVETAVVGADGVNWGGVYLPKCTAVGGLPQQLKVPAGTFETCFVIQDKPQEGSVVQLWFGDVPFNTVKSIETKDGISTTIVLRSFR